MSLTFFTVYFRLKPQWGKEAGGGGLQSKLDLNPGLKFASSGSIQLGPIKFTQCFFFIAKMYRIPSELAEIFLVQSKHHNKMFA
jgi:hypothetical protein